MKNHFFCYHPEKKEFQTEHFQLCKIKGDLTLFFCGGVVASWLMRSTPDQVVWVSSPSRGHCVVFLGKTLYSHSASLHPGVQMGTSKFAGGNPAIDQHPIQGGVAILLAATC